MNNFKKFVIPFVLVLALVVGTMTAFAADSPATLPTPDASNVSLGYTSVVYTGAAKQPKVKIVDELGNTINPQYYEVFYGNNVNAGTGKIIIMMKAPYSGMITKTFTITKATPKVTTSKTYKASSLKKKAYSAKMVKGGSKVVKVSGSSKLTVTKTGYVKVKKGTKKGTYKIKVKVYSSANYKAVTKTITIKVK